MQNHNDVLQGKLDQIGDRIHNLKQRGVCTHGRRKGPGFIDNPAGESTCLDCGKSATWAALDDDASNHF